MCRSQGAALFLSLVLVATACESAAPTAPVSAAEEVELSRAQGGARTQQSAPLLSRLFAQAVAQVRTEQGDAAAARLSAEHRRLAEAARAARAAGDAEAARARQQEAQEEAARVVASVLPRASERVLQMVAEQRAKLDARIAAAEGSGGKAARAREVAQRVTRLQNAAVEALRGGRRAQALLHATMAADLLAGLGHR